METIAELRTIIFFVCMLLFLIIILTPTKDEKKALESWKKRRKI